MAGKKTGELGINQQAISTYETDVNAPIDIVKKICALADVNSAWVLLNEGPKYKENILLFTKQNTPETDHERRLVEKLLAILRGLNRQAARAIEGNIEAFYTSKDLHIDENGNIIKKDEKDILNVS